MCDLILGYRHLYWISQIANISREESDLEIRSGFSSVTLFNGDVESRDKVVTCCIFCVQCLIAMSGFDFSRLGVLPDNVQRKILRMAQGKNEMIVGPADGEDGGASGSRTGSKDDLVNLVHEGFVVSDTLLGLSKDHLKVS